MNNPYDLPSWSKLYREDALWEASRRHLAEKMTASHEPRGLRHLGSAWSNLLASLGATPEPNERPAVEPVK